MQNVAGFEIKLKKIIKHIPISKVRVILIIPEDMRVAYKVFLGRERKMSDDTFVRTQVKSKLSVLNILKNHPEVDVQIFMNFINESSQASSIFKKVDSKYIVPFLNKTLEDLEKTLPNIIKNVIIDNKENI